MKSPYMTLPDETEITHSDICVVDGFEDIIRNGSHLIYKFARQGGFGNAKNF